MGSSASPTTPIWKKWSITQMLAKPASSAVLPISANLGPIDAGASGQVKRGTCNPMRTPGSSVLFGDGSNAGLSIVPAKGEGLLARALCVLLATMPGCEHERPGHSGL